VESNYGTVLCVCRFVTAGVYNCSESALTWVVSDRSSDVRVPHQNTASTH
jgi:hypothetical protein